MGAGTQKATNGHMNRAFFGFQQVENCSCFFPRPLVLERARTRDAREGRTRIRTVKGLTVRRLRAHTE